MTTVTQKINMALASRGMSASDLARAWGTSPQNMIQRIKRGRFTNDEMRRIAEIMNGEWVSEFRFSDGTRI